jgi:hypothetical protein
MKTIANSAVVSKNVRITNKKNKMCAFEKTTRKKKKKTI